MLKNLSERKFEEGIRSGERSAMSSAAAAMGAYFGLKGGEGSDDDGELRMKWAVALLRSGDREGRVLLLEELVGEQRGDATGERAAVLYAETMVAGYERKESTAEDAEDAALLLLGEHPSEKSGLPRTTGILRVPGGRGIRTREAAGGGIEGSRFATRADAPGAPDPGRDRPLRGGTRRGQGQGGRHPGRLRRREDPATATRAKDLYLLSSLKDVEGKVSSGDPKGAAAMLEDLSLRFPDAPEAPTYLLRAMRLYAQSGDPERAIRTGLRFVQEYPRREDVVEAAAVVGPLLEERKEYTRAGDLYEGVASRFPNNEVSPRFLFHAARLAETHGSPETAERRFSAYARGTRCPSGCGRTRPSPSAWPPASGEIRRPRSA